MPKLDDRTFLTGPVRMSYMNLFRPKENRASKKMQYSVTILIPKEPNKFNTKPKEDIDGIAEMIKALAYAKFGADAKGWKRPLRDGDKDLNAEEEPRYPGYWFMNCVAQEEFPPKLIDGDKKDVTGGWESGDWARVKIRLYAYTNESKGVGCGIMAAQFLYQDEHFGSSGNTAEGFDTVEDAHKPGQAALPAAGGVSEEDPWAD